MSDQHKRVNNCEVKERQYVDYKTFLFINKADGRRHWRFVTEH